MANTQSVSFSHKKLKESAINLAGSQLAEIDGTDVIRVKSILEKSKKELTDAYRVLSRLAKTEQDLSPAAEWLIDNFYIIQEQIVQVKVDFPREYQVSIPSLTHGDYKGLPRVYELILDYLTLTDNLLDPEVLAVYLNNYQEVTTLMIGEIWAIPVMIRLILIQRLSEKASRIIYRKNIHKSVQGVIQNLEQVEHTEPGITTNMLSTWLKKQPREGIHIQLIELYQQLEMAGLLLEDQKRWFNYRFKQLDMSLEESMRIEAQKQSRIQVSIQNAVISLRLSAELDWSEFVEECSILEQILSLDPAGIYKEMDFKTRDSYRRTVERLSRRSEKSETETAEQVLLLTERKISHNGQEKSIRAHEDLKNHVGYYLIGEGFPELVANLGYKMPVMERIVRFLERNTWVYTTAIALHTAALMLILWLTIGAFSTSTLTIAILFLVTIFPALDLSVSSVNRFFAFLLPPRILSKMGYKEFIPDESRTMVVVPTLLQSVDDAVRQVEALEIKSLGNPDESIQFALLSDFTDASEKEMQTDIDIVKAAKNEIAKLNKKYQSKFGDKFFLLHRERLWNGSEKKWMGWERKRGKLEEFNRLLQNAEEETSYRWIEGNLFESIEASPVRYVLTLDADTKLPPDSARDLIRTISHPLNRAVLDSDKRIVHKGYGIIQPRISIPPESSRNTWFSRIFSGHVGLDPYSTAVSDIYQDLTGEAVFTGKGIYDVEAFHKVLDRRFPENRILSHDLIESTYLRAGLATDIELFDDYPSTYSSYSKRNHRWVRGDWQIAAWLFSKVPGQEGKEHNPINRLSKWKIFDNLRRSLNPFFLTMFFVAGWFWLPGSAFVWTLAAFGILAFPIYVSLSSDIVNRPTRVQWKLYLVKVKSNLRINSLQAICTLIILPHQAVLNLDAIFRTLYRLRVAKKSLLEWTSAFQTEQMSNNSLMSYTRMMLIPVLLGLAILIIAIYTQMAYLWVAVPFFGLWSGSPFILKKISEPIVSKIDGLGKDDEELLQQYARRTWFYFERFVNEEHSWLPPDNYQEDPPLQPAARTSPTNIGLALVSTVVAYNMGFIPYTECLERVRNTLKSMKKLERYRGHFYNWYDTKLGEVLSPNYVSTVDSGNLAASLIVVKEAVKEAMNTPEFNKNYLDGLQVTIRTVREILDEYWEKGVLPQDCHDNVNKHTAEIMKMLDSANDLSLSESLEMVRACKKYATDMCSIDLMSLRNRLGDRELNDLVFWVESPLREMKKIIDEYRRLQNTGLANITQLSPSDLSRNIDRLSNQPKNVLPKKWQKEAGEIISTCEKFINEMDFSFLYQKKRGLFYVGYNVGKAQADKVTYDLLASEARIASYIAIAKADIPVEHWFRLSRRLTSLNKQEILLSWGGTMFEYLMPLLFMRSYPETLIAHTYANVIKWQRNYGNKRNRPWGFSESAYNFLNLDMHYQYRAFGAPGLGLKRGLADAYVVAPYASVLAMMIDPKSSLDNLVELEKIGAKGLFGFYDAVDFTSSHLMADQSFSVVRTYMVHHHGMSLLAIENILNNWSINRYFHSDPYVRSCELILQEKIPRGVPIKEPHPIDVELEPGERESTHNVVEHVRIDELDETPPRVHLLSNGSFSTFVTHTGTGMAKKDGISLNNWISDPTEDPLGVFVYVRDMETGRFWSAMHQPVRVKPDRYDTWFHNGKVVTSRVDNWIETTTEISVSPDDPIELRKITLTNYSHQPRTIELTSYAEVVLNRYDDHRSHPAFSKLFVQTDYLPEEHSLIVKRRPRTDKEGEKWMIHCFASLYSDDGAPLQYETDRSVFLGRGRSLSHPAAMDKNDLLKGTLGNISDPIVSLRKKFVIEPGEKIECTFGLGYAESREEAVRMADMYDNQFAVNRSIDMANVYSLVELNHIGLSAHQAHYFQKLTSYLLFADDQFRTNFNRLKENRKKQQDLWAYGISGDFPLIIFRLDDTDQIKHVRLLLKAHTFWRMKGLETEVLFLNDHPPSYADEVHEAIQEACETSMGRDLINKRGGIFFRRTEQIPSADLTLLLSVAHVILQNKIHELPKKESKIDVQSWSQNETSEKYRKTQFEAEENGEPKIEDEVKELQFFNGYGGFSEAGDEYQIVINRNPETGELNLPPAPWVNVISNPNFGFIATERGAGYTWSENSRENKLTTWSNDPVKDPHSEAFYIRDEDRKEYWSPTPGPVPGNGDYRVSHGFGYTRFEHKSAEIKQELIQFVAKDDPLKISKLSLKNEGSEARRLSVFRYLDSVLGVDRARSSRFIIPSISQDEQILFLQNYYNNEFSDRVMFASVMSNSDKTQFYYTTSREEFIGRNRDVSCPSALEFDVALEMEIVEGNDPCLALQAVLKLYPGEAIELVFLEGETTSEEAAEILVNNFRDGKKAENELKTVQKFWTKKLSRIQVKTPDRSLDILVNGWLMYQNLSSRMWARTAYYQAGGAYGFRDQLQDSMAVLFTDQKIAKEQILLHAAHQFTEGDVLHWWHPPTGRGVRTRITDDRLWLPYAVHNYLQHTDDHSILHEQIPYIQARALEAYEHEAYLQPERSSLHESLYEHCCKAIEVSLKFGKNGLPLIGTGDWNDGMNLVGENGEGESVWLGFFLYNILVDFGEICKLMDDSDRGNRYQKEAEKLKDHLNTEGWDGEWYLRAFYDDGTPLGSSQNKECQIDAISQAWAILSGVAPKERQEKVLKAVKEHLVSEKDGIIKLLTPPFDRTEKNPGYIKGYIPGVRENGGQYTHGALWVVRAFAYSGLGNDAMNYFSMINPVNHALNREATERYQVEPYVVTADIYGEPPLTGQGGWSWYTGSAGWMYRVAMESILGYRPGKDCAELKPVIPSDWKEFEIKLRLEDDRTTCHIIIQNPDGLQTGKLEGEVDGEPISCSKISGKIPLIKDGKHHKMHFTLKSSE
jgi:cellobiose phosphorylase